MASTLIPCSEALEQVAAQMRSLTPPSSIQSLPLASSLGRVLAAPVTADRDQPPFARSTRDGYAVRAGFPDTSATVKGSIRAGEAWAGHALKDGEAIEIMTGAPVPHGADSVVMLEHITRSGDTVTLQPGRTVRNGENIVPQGAEARRGDALLEPGTCITPAEIALAASVGAATLSVYAQPTAAILSTGDELVDIHVTPGPTQIRSSNAHAIAALVDGNGGLARILPIAADTRDALQGAIASASDAEMLILSGGVSAGKYDFVEEVLLALGAEFLFTGVAMQPGKPVVFGKRTTATHKTQWIFGLPGNPVSTQVTAMLFAMPLLRALGGEAISHCTPRFALAVLAGPITVRPGLTRFLPARVTASLNAVTVVPTGWQGSGDLNSNAKANCYLVVPPEAGELAAGTTVTVLLR